MSSAAIDQVLVAEERLRLAMLVSDCTALDELIGADLIFTDHLGRVVGKKDDLAAHRSGLLRFRSLQPSEMQVKASGDVAVVSVRMDTSGTYDSAPFAADLRYTRVWRLAQNGAWQIIVGHSSQVQG